MYNLNHYILFLLRHLIIAWQTQPSPEDVSSNINPTTTYIRVRLSSAIAFSSYEGRGAVYRLHMHGFPDGPSLSVKR